MEKLIQKSLSPLFFFLKKHFHSNSSENKLKRQVSAYFYRSPMLGQNLISFMRFHRHTHTCSGPISFYWFYHYLYMSHGQIFEYKINF